MLDSDWTFVSFFFGKFALLEEEKQAQAERTLAVPCNLVLFCDDDQTEQYFYEQRRRHHLELQTVIVRLPEMPLLEYKDHVEENRLIWVPGRADAKFSVLYFLRSMSRYYLMLRVIKENPFISDYFAGINLWQKEENHNNTNDTVLMRYLEEIIHCQRRPVSCICQTYTPESVTTRWHRYFANGSSGGLYLGFFTGHVAYMRPFCKAMMAKFRNCVSAGFGYTDSQIGYLVYRDHPEWFELYFGDSGSCLANYKMPRNLDVAHGDFVNQMVPVALQNQDWSFLRKGYRYFFAAENNDLADGSASSINPKIEWEVFERFTETHILRAAVNDAHIPPNCPEFFGRPGYMHFHLLGYISTLFQGQVFLTIQDRSGASALALSTNSANQVFALGTEKWHPLFPANLHFVSTGDDILIQPEKFWKSHIQKARVIFCPVGERARMFFDFLRERNYQGLVIWNGVYLAREFWQHVKHVLPASSVCDWSEWGHWTGTMAMDLR